MHTINSAITVVIAVPLKLKIGIHKKFNITLTIAPDIVAFKNNPSCLHGIKMQFVKKQANIANNNAMLNICNADVAFTYCFPEIITIIFLLSINIPTIAGHNIDIKLFTIFLNNCKYSLFLPIPIYNDNLGSETIITAFNNCFIII